MLNDKGFSRIMSLVLIIVILILLGIVVFVISSKDSEESELVNIVEVDSNKEVSDEVVNTYQFNGLDVSAGGYKVVNVVRGLDENNVLRENVDGEYIILTKSLNQDRLLVIKNYWQDKENGGKKLLEIELSTGSIKEVFQLPNFKVGDKARYISTAAYSPDNNFIAYTTNIDGLEIKDGNENRGPEYVEIWEYDINKDIHTLITQVDGGVYFGLDLVGYSSKQDYLIVYQYTGDASGISFGDTYFVNLHDQSIDKSTIPSALERFTKYDKKDLPPLGRPHLSTNGEYIAFLLPVGSYFGGQENIATPVILYDTKVHEFNDLYQFDKYELGDAAKDWQEVYHIDWNDDKLYLSANKQVLEYNIVTKKLRPLYEWAGGGKSRYEVLATGTNGLMVDDKINHTVIYVDYLQATESEMPVFQNFEYINIYYK